MSVQLYPGMPFSPQAALTNNIGATDTVIEVSDISAFPPAPNLATIGTDEEGETIAYAAKTDTALSGCVRGVEGTAKTWAKGEPIGRNWTAKDHADLIAAVGTAMDAADDAQAAVDNLSTAKQDALTGHPGQVVGFGADGAAEAVQGWSGRNLLINSDFRNPVNRNGKTEYTGIGHTIDRWSVLDGGKLVLNDGYITFYGRSSASYDNFRQSIEPSTYRGLKVTFSVLYRSSNTDWIVVSKNVGSSDVSTRVSNTQGKFELATISVAVSSTAALGFFAVMRTTKGAQTGIDLIAAKLELGDHQTLAHQDEDGNWVLNDPPDYALQYALCSLYSPITGEWTGSQHSNPNLLDNWYFADPINQRGQSEYAPTKYAIDRWRTVRTTLQAADGYVKLVPGDLSANNGYIAQRVENPDIIGKKVTISALTAEGRLYSMTGTPTEKTALALYAGVVLFYVDCAYLPEYRNSPLIGIGINRNANISELNLVAVKLEFGSVQTLAHQDEDGNWVLNDPPPNKALELAKCQRYQTVYSYPSGGFSNATYIAVGIATNSTTARFFIETPVPLRARPAVVIDGFYVARGSSDRVKVRGATVLWPPIQDKVGVQVTCDGANFTVGDVVFLESFSGAALRLDANL